MRSKLNDKAWAILRDNEKLAISLKLGYNKSTWEAGEILEKAHYKFLEIEARAKQFVKMFTEHFEMYEDLIPESISLDSRVRTYFDCVINKRMSIREAVDIVDDDIFNVKTYRESLIVKEMERLIKSQKSLDVNIALMLFDFDRWNNYRVLPLVIQEPSAFKRRNKNNDKRNIKNLLSLNDFSIERIKAIFEFKTKKGKSKILYMPIPSNFGNKMGYGIIEVKQDEETIQELSRIGFFLFTRLEFAQEFYDHILSFDFHNTKSCKDGQLFWPKYRQLVKNSINYNQISRRIASRKFLESAMRDMDHNYLNPKNSGGPKKKRLRKKKKQVL